MNSHLARKSCRIIDLYKDLRDGQMLIKLLEVLSGEMLVMLFALPRAYGWSHPPSGKIWSGGISSSPGLPGFSLFFWEVFILNDVRCPRGWLGSLTCSQNFLPPLASASLHASPGSRVELLTFSTWDLGICGWSAMATLSLRAQREIRGLMASQYPAGELCVLLGTKGKCGRCCLVCSIALMHGRLLQALSVVTHQQ